MRFRYVVRKYRCAKGHGSEILVEDRDRFKPQKCLKCKKRTEPVLLLSRAVLPKATIVYEKLVDGKVERLYLDPAEPQAVGFAVNRGFVKREIQGIARIRKFEREVCGEMRQAAREQMDQNLKEREETYKELHAEWRREFKDADPFTRELVEEAIREQSTGYSRDYDPQFRVGAYS